MLPDLPSDWNSHTIESAMEAIIDYRGKTPRKVSMGIPLITAKIVKGGRILPANEFIAPQDYESWMVRGLPQVRDVVMTTEAPLGEVAQLHDANVGLAQRIITFRGRAELLDNTYLKYALQCSAVQKQLHSRASGTTVMGIRQAELRHVILPCPPLDEQRAIARVLGALDDKIGLNRETNETLEAIARLQFSHECAPFLERGSSSFTPCHQLISDGVLLIGDGYRAKRIELAPTGLPFARAGNIKDGFHFEGAELLGYKAVARAKHKVSEPGDVVFTSKGTVGRFAFVDESTPRFAYSPQLCFWRSLDAAALDPYVLLGWMRSESFLSQVDAVKGQTDMADYVSLRDQKAMSVFVPPRDLQRRLSTILSPMHSRIALNIAENLTLASIRDRLLPMLLSGEIRLKDANKLEAM